MRLATLPYPRLDPVLLSIGPLAIRWYALAYIAGLLLAWWGIVLALRQKRLWAAPPFNGKPPATEDQIGDLVVWATFGVILGGRLGWDLIYGTILCSVSPDADFCRGLPMAFVTDPIKLIAAWEGGMSFHGGLLGVALAVWLFCPQGETQNAADCRSVLRLRAHRFVLWPFGQFRQWRIMGPRHGCALGHDIPPQRRPAASSQPAL